jgi:small subunit ribosomal protein S7
VVARGLATSAAGYRREAATANSRGGPEQQSPGASGRTSPPAASSASSTNTSGTSNRSSRSTVLPRLPSRPWHQLQHAAGYRPPLKAKQNQSAKKGSGGGKKGGGEDGGSGGGGGGGSAAGGDASLFEDEAAPTSDAVRVLLQAVDNITPHLDVRTIRTATKTTYVPGVMPSEKARSLALHWLIAAAEARKKGSKASFAECLALEVLLAYQKRGPARQKRDDLHKLALQNRANLHLRWW